MLTSPRWERFVSDRPFDVSTLVASAFARYPYPESFFVWSVGSPLASLHFFNRTEQRPGWMVTAPGESRFPVIIEQDPVVARYLIDRIRADATDRRLVSIFETSLRGVEYQVVPQLTYRDDFRDHLVRVIGFTVNMEWAKRGYVTELANQVWAIGAGSEKVLMNSVTDEEGRLLVGSAGGLLNAVSRRTFTLIFLTPTSRLISRTP